MTGITNTKWGRFLGAILLDLECKVSANEHPVLLCMPDISTRTECMRSEGIWIRKVRAKRHPVLPDIANISPRTECMRNQGCWIYKITSKITVTHCILAGHN